MVKSRFIIAAALLLLLQACGTYSTSSMTPAAGVSDKIVLAQKSVDQILVTDKDILDRNYTSLGDISVTVRKVTLFDSDPTPEKVNEALKERAAEMGADAIILVRYGTIGISALSWGQMEGNGRAVVFQ